MSDAKLNKMWDELVEQGVSDQTLKIITSINGYNEQTMKDVLFAHTGYRDFDQLDDFDTDEDSDDEDVDDEDEDDSEG